MTELKRTLTTSDAVLIGLSSMIGAGAFVSLGGAYAVAGPLLLVSVLLALAVAWANATSTAQLSAQYPTSGGTYVFGRRQLGEWWGFIAGWGFVVGKIASCAAMALVVAHYVVALVTEPRHGGRASGGAASLFGGGHALAVTVVALVLVAVVTAVNLIGITRTTRIATILVAISISSLLLVAARLAWAWTFGWSVPQSQPLIHTAHEGSAFAADIAPSIPGVLQGAAIMFFAFAGYARVATLGEEVKDPRHTIPKAIMGALWGVAALYLVLGLVLALLLGHDAASTVRTDDLVRAPFAALLQLVDASPFWLLVVTVGAAAAGTGALLALVAGVSRTMLAMARERDLPAALAHVDSRHSVPQRAQVVAGLVIGLVVLGGSTLLAVEFSAFGVLTYYFVANIAAFTQRGEWRIAPRAVNLVGAVACAMLVASLPWPVIAVGLAVFVVGLGYRTLRLRWESRGVPR